MLAAYRRGASATASSRSPRRRSSDAVALADAVAQTIAALASDADVIYQAAFATHDFVGFADFLVRDERGPLDRAGHQARPPRARDRAHAARGIRRPARSARRRALRSRRAAARRRQRSARTRSTICSRSSGCAASGSRALIADRRLDLGADGAAIAWGDPRGELGVVACGRCATCDAEVVASPRSAARGRACARCSASGCAPPASRRSTRSRRAAATPARMNPDTFAMLRTQARLQLESPPARRRCIPPRRRRSPTPSAGDRPAPPVPHRTEVVAPTALGALPRPDHGDLFFDFEGDPLYTEAAARPRGCRAVGHRLPVRLGRRPRAVHARCGRTRSPTRSAALESFLDIVNLRRMQHPGMHIYHYAPYEPTHLLAMAARHGVARGRRRPAAARRRVRRPLSDRAARAARRVAVVLDQEARAAVHGRRGAHERRAEGRRLDRPLRRGARARRRRPGRGRAARSSTTSPTTTATTASRRGGCATGSSIARARRGCARRRTPSRARRPTSRRSAR